MLDVMAGDADVQVWSILVWYNVRNVISTGTYPPVCTFVTRT